MAYKLAIGNKVGIRVEGEYSDASGEVKTYSLVLECDRLNATQLEEKQRAEKEQKIADFFAEITTGWRDQALVLEDNGTPAAFSPEALAAAMTVPGFPMAAYSAYLAQVGVRQKNSLRPRA